MQENNSNNQTEEANSTNKFDWKYLIPIYGVYLVYKSTSAKKGIWWAVSIITTLVGLNIIFGSPNKSSKSNSPPVSGSEAKTESEVAKIDLSEKIKISNCNCNVERKKVRAGEYVAGVEIVKPKYDEILKCKSTLINQNAKKINTGFKVTWNVQTKTGALLETVTSKVEEFLPPNVKVNWEMEETYTFNEEKITDIRKRKALTECKLSELVEVD